MNKTSFTRQEVILAAQGMQRYGGSFMRSLGKALEVADAENTIKILSSWEKEVRSYLDLQRN